MLRMKVLQLGVGVGVLLPAGSFIGSGAQMGAAEFGALGAVVVGTIGAGSTMSWYCERLAGEITWRPLQQALRVSTLTMVRLRRRPGSERGGPSASAGPLPLALPTHTRLHLLTVGTPARPRLHGRRAAGAWVPRTRRRRRGRGRRVVASARRRRLARSRRALVPAAPAPAARARRARRQPPARRPAAARSGTILGGNASGGRASVPRYELNVSLGPHAAHEPGAWPVAHRLRAAKVHAHSGLGARSPDGTAPAQRIMQMSIIKRALGRVVSGKALGESAN